MREKGLVVTVFVYERDATDRGNIKGSCCQSTVKSCYLK